MDILLIEDDPYDAELIEVMLRSGDLRGVRIDRARRLSAALERLASQCYDLVLLDLTLPDEQGLDVFLALERVARDLPIVILTGLADSELARETVRRGAQDYLVKDEVEGRTLARAIHLALERKHLQAESLRLRHEAEEMQRRKSEFVAMVSHELRNPMTGIVGFIHLLSKTTLDPVQRDYVQAISSSSKALVELLNSLLDLSSVESGNLSLESSPFALRELLEEVAMQSLPPIRAKGLEIVASVDPQIPDLVVGDALRFRQVIVNLLSNAIKFTENGYVGISARLRSSVDDEVVIRFVVEDSGRGIPEEKKAAVFQAFTQAKSEDRGRGAGLGLAISQQLIQAMGGVLGLESVAGQGTVFWFDLPFPVHAPTQLSHRFEGRRVLVAESHPPTREALVYAVERMGGLAVQVQNAVEFSHKVQLEDWSLVIVDEPNCGAAKNLTLPCLLHSYPNGDGDPSGLKRIGRPLRLADLDLSQAGLLREVVPTQARAPVTGNVLVVDDDPVCARLVASVAEQCSLVCTIAHSAREAVRLMTRERYDVVVLDFQLPDRNGSELACEIRQLQPDSGGPIILALTGQDLTDRASEFDGVLLKPVEPAQLEEWFHIPQFPVSVDWSILERFRKYQKGSNSNLLRDLVQTFTDSAMQRAEALQLAALQGRQQEAQRVAHLLRGAAASVGAVAVAAVAEQIEECPQQKSLLASLRRELHRSLEQFGGFLSDVEA